MDRLDIGFFPKAGVDTCFKAFVKDKLKGCGNFVFALFDELDGYAINAMGFLGIEFVNDAYYFRSVDDDAIEIIASTGGDIRGKNAVIFQNCTIASKKIIKAFRFLFKIGDERAID